jgi:hypothetical protein
MQREHEQPGEPLTIGMFSGQGRQFREELRMTPETQLDLRLSFPSRQSQLVESFNLGCQEPTVQAGIGTSPPQRQRPIQAGSRTSQIAGPSGTVGLPKLRIEHLRVQVPGPERDRVPGRTESDQLPLGQLSLQP